MSNNASVDAFVDSQIFKKSLIEAPPLARVYASSQIPNANTKSNVILLPI